MACQRRSTSVPCGSAPCSPANRSWPIRARGTAANRGWVGARHDPDREPAGCRDRTRCRPHRARRPCLAGAGSGRRRRRRSARPGADLAHRAASHHARPAAGSCSARASTTDGSPRSIGEISAPGSSSTAASTAGTCPPRTLPRTVTFRWTAQRTVTIGLWLSRLAVVMCIALAILYRPRHFDDAARPPRLVGFGRERPTSWRRVVAGPVVAAVVGLLLCRSGVGTGGVGRRRLCRRAGPVPIAWRRGAGDLAGVRGDRAVARRAVPTVPERRVAEHVRGPSPARHARARPARRVGGDPDGRSHERPHGGSRGAPTDTCPGGHRAATRSSLAYS